MPFTETNSPIFPAKLPVQLGVLGACLWLATALSGSAATHYVDLNSPNPTPPHTNWATAATNIQDAVDAAASGDEVIVTNGIYATGGRSLDAVTTNRVAVDKALNVRSVNGPEVTEVEGLGQERCVYLTNGARLAGFTLAHGIARSGAGVWSASLSVVVSNCILLGNSAKAANFNQAFGGGAYGGTLENCLIASNSVTGYSDDSGGVELDAFGGGAYGSTLDNCELRSNSANPYPVLSGGDTVGYGGGACNCNLSHCTFAKNSANVGAGADACTLNTCALSGNSADLYGAGAADCTLINCTLSTNSLLMKFGSYGGGGATFSFLTNCTLTRNVSGGDPTGYGGGGASLCTLDHCVLIGNRADTGIGAYNGGGAFNSTLSHCTLSANWARYAGGGAAASILDDCLLSVNSASDGSTMGEGGGAAYSDLRNCVLLGNAAGYGGGAHQGNLTNCTLTGNSAADYGGGASGCVLTACALESNHAGYGGGTHSSSLYNCAVSGNSAEMSGGGVSASALQNCALTGNSANGWGVEGFGGGADSSTLNNCTLTGNWGYYGGGASECSLSNCTLAGNWVLLYDDGYPPDRWGGSGGGASVSTLVNCTLTCNSAQSGGGVGSDIWLQASTLNNCIVWSNTAAVDPNYDINSVLNYCCTIPAPAAGFGNIANAPLFVDEAGGNLRLQSNSPCINAGNNAYAPAGPDLDGNPRVAGSTVDIGAYEYQSPTSIISYAWLQQYGLLTDGSADFADQDGDGVNNWQEWRCGTVPTNSLSALRLLSPGVTRTNVTVSWQSVAGVNYFLERSTNLAAPAAFMPAATNILGQPGTTSYLDTNAFGSGPFFYRVGVQ